MADTKAAAGASSAPAFHLVVIHDFGDYQRGARITDADEIARVSASENAAHCNKVAPQ